MSNFERANQFFNEEPTAKQEPHFNGLRRERAKKHGIEEAMQSKRLLLLHQYSADLLLESIRLYDTGKFLEYAERQQELQEQYLQTLSRINKELR